MRTKGADGVGRVAIDFEVANYGDLEMAERGLLAAEQVRRMTIGGVVDSGATRFVLPALVVKQLGLRIAGKVRVRYADGRRATRATAQGAYVKILGRDSTFSAVVEPKRKNALIGVIVLEDLDLLLDCQRQRLVPRDPRGPIYEIE